MMLTNEWTRQDIVEEFNGCSNLGELISAVEKNLSPDGQMVCEVHVNGLYLSEQEEGKFSSTPIQDISHLKIKSRSLKDLVGESMNTIRHFVPRIKASALEASDHFRDGQELQAQTLLTEVIDGCQWVAEALGLLKNELTQRFSEKFGYAEMWADQEESYKAMVEELLQGFDNNDTILLADVLEYEVTTCLDKWLELLPAS